jgi:hypothetical protein
MKARSIRGPGFTVSIPEDWHDITDVVETHNPPFTLAQEDGVGALQFPIALYSGDQAPNPSCEDLLEMVADFGKSHRMGKSQDIVKESGDTQLPLPLFDMGRTLFAFGISLIARTTLLRFTHVRASSSTTMRCRNVRLLSAAYGLPRDRLHHQPVRSK